MDPSEIFGVDEEASMLGAPGFAHMTQPQDMDLMQYVRPAANPEELGQRRSMWSQIVTQFQTNPNLQRALALTGAMMMQPIRPGQTTMGQVGNAAVVGMNAYQMGQQADYERSSKERQEGREERRLGIAESAAAREAGREPLVREGMEADVEGKRVRTKLTTEQINAAVEEAREKKDGSLLREMQRRLQEEETRTKLAIPAGERLNAELNNLRTMKTKLDLAEQQLAGAREDTAVKRMTREELEKMPESERRDYLLKRNKFGNRQLTSIEAQRDVLTGIWQMKSDEEKRKQPLDKFLEGMLLKSKPEDTLKAVNSAIENAELVGEVPAEWMELQKQLMNQMAGRAGVSQTPAAAAPSQAPASAPAAQKPQGTRDNPVVVNTKAERDALPAGTVYRAPDGKLRIKQ